MANGEFVIPGNSLPGWFRDYHVRLQGSCWDICSVNGCWSYIWTDDWNHSQGHVSVSFSVSLAQLLQSDASRSIGPILNPVSLPLASLTFRASPLGRMRCLVLRPLLGTAIYTHKGRDSV